MATTVWTQPGGLADDLGEAGDLRVAGDVLRVADPLALPSLEHAGVDVDPRHGQGSEEIALARFVDPEPGVEQRGIEDGLVAQPGLADHLRLEDELDEVGRALALDDQFAGLVEGHVDLLLGAAEARVGDRAQLEGAVADDALEQLRLFGGQLRGVTGGTGRGGHAPEKNGEGTAGVEAELDGCPTGFSRRAELLNVGSWTLNVGRWTLDVGRWTLSVRRSPPLPLAPRPVVCLRPPPVVAAASLPRARRPAARSKWLPHPTLPRAPRRAVQHITAQIRQPAIVLHCRRACYDAKTCSHIIRTAETRFHPLRPGSGLRPNGHRRLRLSPPDRLHPTRDPPVAPTTYAHHSVRHD
jgi:hypothetical protein